MSQTAKFYNYILPKHCGHCAGQTLISIILIGLWWHRHTHTLIMHISGRKGHLEQTRRTATGPINHPLIHLTYIRMAGNFSNPAYVDRPTFFIFFVQTPVPRTTSKTICPVSGNRLWQRSSLGTAINFI